MISLLSIKSALFLQFACITTLFSTQSLLDLSKPEDVVGCDYILSYPRSGRHMVLNVVQNFFQREIRTGVKLSRKLNFIGKDVNLELPSMYKSHQVPFGFERVDPSKNKLILLLRNYKECIPRHQKQAKQSDFNIDRLKKIILDDNLNLGEKKRGNFFGDTIFGLYVNNLYFFENWSDEDTKLLVYYEDVISDPIESFKKILCFLDKDFLVPDDFEEQIYAYLEISKKIYKKKFGAHASSGGKKEIYHSKSFPLSELQKIDSHIEEHHPMLWEKYLSRYKSM